MDFPLSMLKLSIPQVQIYILMEKILGLGLYDKVYMGGVLFVTYNLHQLINKKLYRYKIFDQLTFISYLSW